MILPPESLIPFKANRLANARTGYVNPDYSGPPSDWLARFAYMMPNSHTQASHFLAQEKTFHAERYGGARIVTHGGGVRCGLDGDFSVKGIGCNPVMGRDARQRNPFYADGALRLSEAVQEAIWGNVLNIALPFGAVRVTALILTGVACPKGTGESAPGALVVREAILRPAHFERAVYFRPQPDIPLVHDVERVRQAIGQLPSALPLPSGLSAEDTGSLTPAERLNLGLEQLSERFAAQSAVAVSKRFVHGALTASNIALDGRWLDFGTTLSFGTYANATLGRTIPPLWEEYLGHVPTLQNLCFYIGKYFHCGDATALPKPQALLQNYLFHYQKWLIRAFLSLAGYPAPLWQGQWNSEDAIQLASLFVATARSDVERPFIAATPDWERFDPNRLAAALPILACWHDHPSCEARLLDIVQQDGRRIALIKAYHAVATKLTETARNQGVHPQALRRLAHLNASKVAKNIPAINAGHIYQRYRQDDHFSPEELQSLIDNTTDKARVLYQPSTFFESFMWKTRGEEISYDALGDQWKRVSGKKIQHLPWDALHSSRHLSGMKEYWGKQLWADLTERENVSHTKKTGETTNA